MDVVEYVPVPLSLSVTLLMVGSYHYSSVWQLTRRLGSEELWAPARGLSVGVAPVPSCGPEHHLSSGEWLYTIGLRDLGPVWV